MSRSKFPIPLNRCLCLPKRGWMNEYWLVRASKLEPRLQPALGVRPRNQLNGSAVNLLTLLNLVSPGLLGILVHFDV